MPDTLSVALVAGIVSLTVSGIGWLIADANFRAQHGAHDAAERVVKRLLNHRKWTQRSFGDIKRRLGGFDDDEIRRLLVRAGALRFHKNGTMTFPKEGSDDELWGLLRRNKKNVA